MSPQISMLRKYNLENIVKDETLEVLSRNQGIQMSSYMIWNEFSESVKQQIKNMIDLEKDKRGVVDNTGFYIEASYAGAVASMLEKNNSNIDREEMRCPYREKKSTCFVWR